MPNACAGPARSSKCSPETSKKTTLVTIWSAYNLIDRGDGREPPGERVLGPLDDRAGRQRARVGEQLLDRLVPGRVAVRDRVGGGRLGDERDLIAEVEGHPGGGLGALLGPDPADHQLGDALLSQQLLQVCSGERVMRGLGELWLAGVRGPRGGGADVPASGVERGP